jgi:hypothetical protein
MTSLMEVELTPAALGLAPEEAGRNELVVAVSEDFGGWGVQARLVED